MNTLEAPTGVLFKPVSQNLKPASVLRLQPLEAFLLGPRADVLMIGGASMVVCLLYWMFVDLAAPIGSVAYFAYALSFVINFPHFASSYQLLYGQYRKQILRKKSFFWAAVLAPVLIAAAIAAGIVWSSQAMLAFMVQAMFLTVGWHYVKQIYGVSLLASAVQKRYFGAWERNLILLNLYSVWALSWVSGNLTLAKADLDGVMYFTLGLPNWLLAAAYVSTGVTLVFAAAALVHKYIKTGIRPANSSLIGFASIYFWYLPAMNHPAFFYLIPFFHSLQYMLFVFAMKKNEAMDAAGSAENEEDGRRIFVRKLCGFLALAAILGAVGFELLPRGLDAWVPIGAGLPYSALWFFSINLFINLHHYFIDNVIWRGDNEFLKLNLVQASQKRAIV